MVLLLLVGCVHVGSSGLSTAIPAGIGGLVATSGSGPDPLVEEAWARLHATDAELDRILAWPPMRWAAAARDLKRRLAAGHVIERRLSEVVNLGAAEPGLAALVRLGRLYEANHTWLTAEPRVAPLFRSATWATLYPVLRPFGAPAPYLTTPAGADPGCPVFPEREKAVAAYELVEQKSAELGLLADPSRRYALARLEALDPEGHPHRWERLPTDGAGPELEP